MSYKSSTMDDISNCLVKAYVILVSKNSLEAIVDFKNMTNVRRNERKYYSKMHINISEDITKKLYNL